MTLVILALLGAWVALDGTAFGQFMVSRPVMSGTLAGWIVGDPLTGFLVGGVLELLFLGGLPVGGVRLHEPGPAAIPAVWLAVGWGGWVGPAAGGALAGGVAVGLLLAWLGGVTVHLQRVRNGRISRAAWARGGGPPALARAQALALLTDGARGLLLTTLGLGVTTGLLLLGGGTAFASHWPLTGAETLALLLAVSALSLGRQVQTAAGGRTRVVTRPLLLVAAGIAGGVLLGLLLGVHEGTEALVLLPASGEGAS